MLHVMDRLFVDRIAPRLERDGDCLIWTGCKVHNGYGQISVQGKRHYVHRLVYKLLVGPIPDGHVIDHVKERGCKSRACCNVDHLEPVLPLVNTMRGDGPTARNAAKTHCPNGHPLEGDNLRRERDGGRRCRICARARMRKYRLRLKEEAVELGC